jgi:hypothetical protein
MAALVHALGLGKRRMIMPRLGLRIASPPVRLALACVRLTVASLILVLAIAPAASAQDCSNRYKVCNGACDRPPDAVDQVFACKSVCDFRLIACDREPVNAYAPGENRHSLRGVPMKVIDPPSSQREAR